MAPERKFKDIFVVVVLLLALLLPAGELLAGKIYKVSKSLEKVTATDEAAVVKYRCLTPEGNDKKLFTRTGKERWAMPSTAEAALLDTTIRCLVLRFNFQLDNNPNTTGDGEMDLSRPLDTLTDSQYVAIYGHEIDPPPHDSLYFDAHMRALNRYWETVSDQKLHLSWDIFPPQPDAVYTLPHEMSFYGRCDLSEVVNGLDSFFVNCIKLADTAHLFIPGHPDINFSQYDAIFLFHAGSDRQNDFGFPPTCNDLFTGFIKSVSSVTVDNGADTIRTALMMPETAMQDGRITALNSVIAHEFGHQLGLVDLYNTQNGFTQLGDFALMDNNGMATGIDFGWPAGGVFGAMPLYPSAWSRAFLGFIEVEDFRDDTTGVRLMAAELPSDSGLQIARIPISENEYYLVENRTDEVDGKVTNILADSATSVIQGPVNSNREFNSEYDFLLPGAGMLIYLVDEDVAARDWDGDGLNNFADNDLQWYLESEERKFITLIEADGVVQFGGNYWVNFGTADEMFREDRNSQFTPYTNPAAIDNSGNNTHIFVTNIHRDTIFGSTVADNKAMKFDLEIDRKVDGFPVWAGVPLIGIAPVVHDFNNDGNDEIIVATLDFLSVFNSDGSNYIRSLSGCDTITCPPFYDTSFNSFDGGTPYTEGEAREIPLFAQTGSLITTTPVVGTFNTTGAEEFVIIGHPDTLISVFGQVEIYQVADVNSDARADLFNTLQTIGLPLVIASNGSQLYVLTNAESDTTFIYHTDDPAITPAAWLSSRYIFTGEEFIYGIALAGDKLILQSGDSLTTSIHVISDSTIYTTTETGRYSSGPIIADINRDDQPEVIMFTSEGDGLIITIDTSNSAPSFSTFVKRSTGFRITTNPIAADIDMDGYPEIIVAGENSLIAFNSDLIVKTDFPRILDGRYPQQTAIASPVVADIETGGMLEIVVPSSVGNFYSYGEDETFGFPLSSGEQLRGRTGTSAVIFNDSTGGKLGYLGGDGWFYCWEISSDISSNFWPMWGNNSRGTFALEQSKLPAIANTTEKFDSEKYYNYPNPVTTGETTIRYFLGEEATNVSLKIYDLSGYLIESLNGSTIGGVDNEVVWDCNNVMTGVYRCIINVEFPGSSESAYTDIAILK